MPNILSINLNGSMIKSIKSLQIAIVKCNKLCYELFPSSAIFFSELAPINNFLFRNLKKRIGGQKHGCNDEIIAQTNACIGNLEKAYCLHRVEKLRKRWMKCLELKRDHVDKLNVFSSKNLYFIHKVRNLLTHPIHPCLNGITFPGNHFSN